MFLRLWSLFLLPILLFSMNEKECKSLRREAKREWKKHAKLVEKFVEISPENKAEGIHFLEEALRCCEYALHLMDRILHDFSTKSSWRRTKAWRRRIEDRCVNDRGVFLEEITAIKNIINEMLSEKVMQKTKVFLEEGLQVAGQAKKIYADHIEGSSVEDQELLNIEEAISLYKKAEELMERALEELAKAPIVLEESKELIESYRDICGQSAEALQKNAEEKEHHTCLQQAALE